MKHQAFGKSKTVVYPLLVAGFPNRVNLSGNRSWHGFRSYQRNSTKIPYPWWWEMSRSPQWQRIPTHLSLEQFQQFVLPHLTVGSRGPSPKLPLHAVFNYILQVLYLGCQWKKLPIEKDRQGRPEIHYTRVYSAFRRWQADGCLDAIFRGSVGALQENHHLDISVIHGDGTTTAAKKGGDNIGFSGHKKVKGDKVVAFCDRNCNMIAPFVRKIPRVRAYKPPFARLRPIQGEMKGEKSRILAYTP